MGYIGWGGNNRKASLMHESWEQLLCMKREMSSLPWALASSCFEQYFISRCCTYQGVLIIQSINRVEQESLNFPETTSNAQWLRTQGLFDLEKRWFNFVNQCHHEKKRKEKRWFKRTIITKFKYLKDLFERMR